MWSGSFAGGFSISCAQAAARKAYGGFEAYLEQGLGLSAAQPTELGENSETRGIGLLCAVAVKPSYERARGGDWPQMRVVNELGAVIGRKCEL